MPRDLNALCDERAPLTLPGNPHALDAPGARQRETREAQDSVIEAVPTAFTEAGIRTGNDVRIVEMGPQLRGVMRTLVLRKAAP